MSEHDITKALEVWTLQTLLNVSILLGVLALRLALVQGYYRSLEKHLTLRVSIELWRVATVVFADVVLVIIVLVGLLKPLWSPTVLAIFDPLSLPRNRVPRMPWSKHKGKRVEQIPLDYLEWLTTPGSCKTAG